MPAFTWFSTQFVPRGFEVFQCNEVNSHWKEGWGLLHSQKVLAINGQGLVTWFGKGGMSESHLDSKLVPASVGSGGEGGWLVSHIVAHLAGPRAWVQAVRHTIHFHVCMPWPLESERDRIIEHQRHGLQNVTQSLEMLTLLLPSDVD